MILFILMIKVNVFNKVLFKVVLLWLLIKIFVKLVKVIYIMMVNNVVIKLNILESLVLIKLMVIMFVNLYNLLHKLIVNK